MVPSISSTFVKGFVASTAGIAALYGLSEFVPVRPLIIPGYLLITGFDFLEVTFGSAGSFYRVLFALYIVSLGFVGGLFAHAVRTAARAADIPAWRLGLAAGFAIVSVIAFLFAAMIYSGTSQMEPVRITGATGVVLLVLALLIADGPRLVAELRSP